jgi:hypothetical protein
MAEAAWMISRRFSDLPDRSSANIPRLERLENELPFKRKSPPASATMKPFADGIYFKNKRYSPFISSD